jgi:hypothetical protein
VACGGVEINRKPNDPQLSLASICGLIMRPTLALNSVVVLSYRSSIVVLQLWLLFVLVVNLNCTRLIVARACRAKRRRGPPCAGWSRDGLVAPLAAATDRPA